MARTPRTVELASISLRCPQEVRDWLEQRMKDTRRQSLNEVVNDLIDDVRTLYKLPKAMVEALDRDRKAHKVPDLREYIVGLLLERYVSLQRTS